MKFKGKMVYLGYENKESKKSGNQYIIAKFMNPDSAEIYEFYVAGDKVKLVTEVSRCAMFQQYNVMMEITSYQNKPQVDLAGVSE